MGTQWCLFFRFLVHFPMCGDSFFIKVLFGTVTTYPYNFLVFETDVDPSVLSFYFHVRFNVLRAGLRCALGALFFSRSPPSFVGDS